MDANRNLAGFGTGDTIGGDFAVLPLDVHGEPAAGAQALDAAGRPGAGQRGQEMDQERAIALADVALQQHLGDAGAGAEVAVDLERRVGVEQVGIQAAAALRWPTG